MVRFMAVGDVMMGRLVGERAKREVGFYPFSRVAGVLAGADLLFCNLETCLSERGEPEGSKIHLRAAPEMAGRLRKAGFNVVSLANNHVFDYGVEAFSDTIDALEQEGITWVGAGCNLEQAKTVRILRVKELSVGFLACTYAFTAGPESPGCAPSNARNLFDEVEKARGLVDILVVSLHEGIEFSDYPTPGLIKTARSMIDHGATIVIGHHPHNLQGVEKYKDGLIAYSLGDFVFDNVDENIRRAAYHRTALSLLGSEPLASGDLRTLQSMILECRLDAGGIKSYKLVPVIIGEDYQPSIALGDDRELILDRLKNISAPLADPESRIWLEMRRLEKGVRLLSLNRMSGKEIIGLVPHFKPRYIKKLFLLLWSKIIFFLKKLKKGRKEGEKTYEC